MNIISLILAIIGIVIFVLSYEGHKYGSLGLGLAFISTAWVLQLLWSGRPCTKSRSNV